MPRSSRRRIRRPKPCLSLVQANRHLYDVLRARGYDVRYDESSTGHDYVAWRDALALGLEHLLGRPAGAEAGRGE